MAVKIDEVSADQGFLEEARISFNDGLNCIIGARGTCKSTLIETIRFVFNNDEKRIEEMIRGRTDRDVEMPSHTGLLRATLGSGTAQCRVVDSENSVTIERDLDSQTRVYREGIKQVEDDRLLHQLEIYSQGELQLIAEDSVKRLELVDRPNKDAISRLSAIRKEQALKISEIGPRIQTIRQNIETLKASLKGLPQFREQLLELQKDRPSLSDQLETEHKRFQNRQMILEKAKEALAERSEIVNRIKASTSTDYPFKQVAESLRGVDTESARSISAAIEDFSAYLASTNIATAKIETSFGGALAQLESEFDKLSQNYFKLRKEQSFVSESLKKEEVLKVNIGKLEQLQTQLEGFAKNLDSEILEREKCRKKIEDASNEIFKLRISQVDEINKKYHKKIMLTLHQGTQSSPYREFLNELLQGSRIRNREQLSVEISQKITPEELVGMVEDGESKRLAECISIDPSTAAKIISFFHDNPEFYRVESNVFKDELEITMFDKSIPKRVDQLSKGQKATAMLPLILRHAEYPLIFDQPEDDLDNRFIYETLVEQIRELKKTRQLIFITHNANIPVLGEADRVIVMEMKTPTKADIPRVGTVDEVKDEILDLLEGGAEAFKLRQQKYGSSIV